MRINVESIAVVLVRAVSIYLVAMGLSNSTFIMSNLAFWEETDSESRMLALVALGAPLVVAVFLWFAAKWLASLMVSGREASLDSEDTALVGVGTFLIGLFWALNSIQSLIITFPYGLAKTIPSLVLLGLSVVLMLGNSFVAMCFEKLRTAGLSHNKSFKADA